MSSGWPTGQNSFAKLSGHECESRAPPANEIVSAEPLDKSAELNAYLLCRTEAAAHPNLAKVIFAQFQYSFMADRQMHSKTKLWRFIIALPP